MITRWKKGGNVTEVIQEMWGATQGQNKDVVNTIIFPAMDKANPRNVE